MFFDTGSATLNERDIRSLNTLDDRCFWVVRERVNGGALRVAGHADKTGSTKANFALSWRRAKVVCEYLVSTGVPRDRIIITAAGDTQPWVMDKKAEPQNRRVELGLLLGDTMEKSLATSRYKQC